MAAEKEVQIKISGKVDNSLNTVSQKVDKAFSKMMKVAKSATLIGGTAATAAVTGAVKVGSSFESQMSTVEAISGAAEKQIMQLEEKAKEMGATTKFTATESGQAMEYMAMAGWKTKDMLNGIGGIMDLAAASGEDLAGTSDIVTDALTAFNLQAKDSAHFADILAQASSNSNTNVSMMGETFKYVAPVAGSLGYTAEDTAVSIGLLANAGIKASQGGTVMRKLMSETAGGITLVSKAYAKAGEKTGKYKIETANADGSMKDWSQTVEVLREQFSKMTEEEQAMNAESIAGKTAMSGLLAIVNASDKDYEKLTNSIDNASGAAKRMAKIRLDNLQGDVTIFQSALEGKGIELYDELKEPMRDIVQSATDWLEEIDVARVVDDFKDFGAAVLDFADPLLEVGEWMIENPDAIAGPLAGIGGTIAGYKLLDTIPKLGQGLEGLISGVTASPYIAGGALAAGALTGIGTAIVNTERAAANASLDDHFGDIALSMDQIQDAADSLIGSKKLENIEKFMSSIKISEGFEREMKKAAEGFGKIKWKVSAGLELDEKDMDEARKNAQNYVQSVQDQIDQQGYTVNVATKFLFGDSETGKDIIEQNDGFFGSLKMEADGLNAKINDVIQRSMKPNLKPRKKKKLIKEMNKYLEELKDLSAKVAKGKERASWDLIESDFSGKDLTPDTFQKLQEATNKNVEKVKKIAYETKQTVFDTAGQKLENGNMSEEEYEQEKEAAEKAYRETVERAKKKATEIQYNTLMDTYGEDLINGDMGRGDKNAVHDMVVDMMGGATGEIKEKLVTIEKATSGTYVTDFMDGVLPGGPTDSEKAMQEVKNMVAEYKYGEGTTVKEKREEKGFLDPVLAFATPNLPNITKTMEESTTGLQATPVNILDGFVAAVPPAVAKMEEEARRGGTASGEAFAKALSDEILKINPINIPVAFSALGLSGLAEEGNGNASPIIIRPDDGHAEGIISTKAHIAAVSEGNKPEAIIPINSSARSRRLYEATGKLMGYNKNSTQGMTFAPTINITLTGKATSENKNEIRNLVQKELEKQYKKMVRDNKRFNMRQ